MVRAQMSVAYPNRSDDLGLFRARIRKSPNDTIDTKWLMDNLGYTQSGNARMTERWLHAAAIINGEGRLSDSGRLMLAEVDDDDGVRQASRDAIQSLIGRDFYLSIEAGTVNESNVRDRMRQVFGLGDSVLKRVLGGLAALANLTGDAHLIACFPKTSRGTAAGRPGTAKKETKGTAQQDNENVGRKIPRPTSAHSDARQEEDQPSHDLDLEPGLPGEAHLFDVVRVQIDGSWELEKIRETLRLLQLVQAGVPIPEG